MRPSILLLALAIGAICIPDLSAQSRRWIPIAELTDDRVTAMEAIDATTTLLGTSKPSLISMRGDSVEWTLDLDSMPLPYFIYPHEHIVDIHPVSADEVLLAFHVGHGMRVNLRTREFEQVELFPLHFFAESGDGTIIGGSRYRSTDRGVTWDTMPASARPGDSFVAVAGGPGSVFYASGGLAGLWISTDGGLSWSERPALTSTSDSLSGSGRPLALFDERTALVGAADSRTIERRNKALYKTTDAGGTWRAVFRYPEGMVFGAEGTQEGESVIIGLREVGGPYQIFLTTDAGETWVEMSEGIDQRGASSGYFSMRDGNVLAFVEGNRFLLYRLSQSSGVTLPDDTGGASLHIVPNPAADVARITVNLATQARGVLEVFDARGGLLGKGRAIDIPTGVSTHSIDLSTVSAGVYRVRISGEHGLLLESTFVVVR